MLHLLYVLLATARSSLKAIRELFVDSRADPTLRRSEFAHPNAMLCRVLVGAAAEGPEFITSELGFEFANPPAYSSWSAIRAQKHLIGWPVSRKNAFEEALSKRSEVES